MYSLSMSRMEFVAREPSAEPEKHCPGWAGSECPNMVSPGGNLCVSCATVVALAFSLTNSNKDELPALHETERACSVCGNSIPTEAQFCVRCGTSVAT